MENLKFVDLDDYLIWKLEKTKSKNGEKSDRWSHEDFMAHMEEEYRENF